MPQDTTMTGSSKNLPQVRSIALIALGSNTPNEGVDPREVLLAGVESVREKLGVIRGLSDVFSTPAFPPGSGPDFVNAALVLETTLDAATLLAALHEIEADHGRERRTRWAPRSLDLDLLDHGAQILPSRQEFEEWRSLPTEAQQKTAPSGLVLPHPRMQDRGFVLVPLEQALQRADVRWLHPVLGVNVPEMIQALPKSALDEIKPLFTTPFGA